MKPHECAPQRHTLTYLVILRLVRFLFRLEADDSDTTSAK